MAKTVSDLTHTGQVNSFTGGLNTDLHPLVQPNDTLTDCVNGTLITYNGNENMLQNDMGNYALEGAELPIGYVPIGMKEHKGVIYIVSNNPQTNKTQIGSYPSPQHYSYSTSITEAGSWYNTTMDLNDQTRWNIFLSGTGNTEIQFDLTKYYYSNYLKTSITSIIGNYSEESKVYPTDKYIIEDKSLDCLQSVKYSLITELGKEVDLVYNNDDNIVGTVTNTDSGWLKRVVELYSDFEYKVDFIREWVGTRYIKHNLYFTPITNDLITQVRIGVLHTQLTNIQNEDGTETTTKTNNIYISDDVRTKTWNFDTTTSFLKYNADVNEFSPFIAIQLYGTVWHLIIYDDKKYTDEMQSDSEELSLIKKFQYSTIYTDKGYNYNYTIDLNIELANDTSLNNFDYRLTYLQNSLGNVISEDLVEGVAESIDSTYKIYCDWPENIDFLLLEFIKKEDNFQFVRPIFKDVQQFNYTDVNDFSTIQFYATKVKVSKTENTDKTYYAHCLGDNISSSNLIISDKPTNPYTTTDPKGYYGVVQKSDCTFKLTNCKATSAIINTVLELDDDSTVILSSQYKNIDSSDEHKIDCNLYTAINLNKFIISTTDSTTYKFLGDRQYLIEDATDMSNKNNITRNIVLDKVGGNKNNSVELLEYTKQRFTEDITIVHDRSKAENKLICSNSISAQQFLNNTKFLFTRCNCISAVKYSGILNPYTTYDDKIAGVVLKKTNVYGKLIKCVNNGHNIMGAICIQPNDNSLTNLYYSSYKDSLIFDKLELLALTSIYRYKDLNINASHLIEQKDTIEATIKYKINFTDLTVKYNNIDIVKINKYLHDNFSTTFGNFELNNLITTQLLSPPIISNNFNNFVTIYNAQLKNDTNIYDNLKDVLTVNTFCVDNNDYISDISNYLQNFANRLKIYNQEVRYDATDVIEYDDSCALGGNMGGRSAGDNREYPEEGNGWVSIAYPIKYELDSSKRDLLMVRKGDTLYKWLGNNQYSIDKTSPIFKNIYPAWLK